MMIRRLLVLLLLATFPAAVARADGRAGDFDFYVLSLSWSPTYCASESDPDPSQCDTGPRGFVVHGLWPQYESGYPEYCPTSYSRGLSQSTLAMIRPVMPSPGLARYQWRKHGMCSGLNERDYFSLVVRAARLVKVPPSLAGLDERLRVSPAAVETTFVAANPGLPRSGISVQCRGGQLTEVRVCLTKDLEFRPCLEVDEDSCRASQVSVPPSR